MNETKYPALDTSGWLNRDGTRLSRKKLREVERHAVQEILAYRSLTPGLSAPPYWLLPPTAACIEADKLRKKYSELSTLNCKGDSIEEFVKVVEEQQKDEKLQSVLRNISFQEVALENSHFASYLEDQEKRVRKAEAEWEAAHKRWPIHRVFFEIIPGVPEDEEDSIQCMCLNTGAVSGLASPACGGEEFALSTSLWERCCPKARHRLMIQG